MGMLLSFFRVSASKPHANLTSINGNIKEILPESIGFSMVFAIVVVFKSRDSPPCIECQLKTDKTAQMPS